MTLPYLQHRGCPASVGCTKVQLNFRILPSYQLMAVSQATSVAFFFHLSHQAVDIRSGSLGISPYLGPGRSPLYPFPFLIAYMSRHRHQFPDNALGFCALGSIDTGLLRRLLGSGAPVSGR